MSCPTCAAYVDAIAVYCAECDRWCEPPDVREPSVPGVAVYVVVSVDTESGSHYVQTFDTYRMAKETYEALKQSESYRCSLHSSFVLTDSPSAGPQLTSMSESVVCPRCRGIGRVPKGE